MMTAENQGNNINASKNKLTKENVSPFMYLFLNIFSYFSAIMFIFTP